MKQEEPTYKWIEIGLSLVIAALFVLGYYMWFGLVASYLWKWFIVPITGLPPINMVRAIGLSIVVQLFLFRNHIYESDHPLKPFAFVGTVWAVGWFFSLFL